MKPRIDLFLIGKLQNFRGWTPFGRLHGTPIEWNKETGKTLEPI